MHGHHIDTYLARNIPHKHTCHTYILNLIANDHFIGIQHKCKADVLPLREIQWWPCRLSSICQGQVPERLLAASLPPAPLELPGSWQPEV